MNLTATDAIKYIVFLVGVGVAVGTMQGQIARLTVDVQQTRAEMLLVSSKLDRYIEMLVDERAARASRDAGVTVGGSTRRSGR